MRVWFLQVKGWILAEILAPKSACLQLQSASGEVAALFGQ
jgi:hypothetical protein